MGMRLPLIAVLQIVTFDPVPYFVSVSYTLSFALWPMDPAWILMSEEGSKLIQISKHC